MGRTSIGMRFAIGSRRRGSGAALDRHDCWRAYRDAARDYHARVEGPVLRIFAHRGSDHIESTGGGQHDATSGGADVARGTFPARSQRAHDPEQLRDDEAHRVHLHLADFAPSSRTIRSRILVDGDRRERPYLLPSLPHRGLARCNASMPSSAISMV